MNSTIQKHLTDDKKINRKIGGSTNKKIRGPNIVVLIEANYSVPFETGLARADAKNKVVASNERIERAIESKEWEYNGWVFRAEQEPLYWASLLCASPCWTGTMTGYVEPERTFREGAEKIPSLGNGYFIVYVDPETKMRWLFPVPEKHLDKKNAILVTEQPDYSLEVDGRTRIVRAAQVDLIENFPSNDGQYHVDAQHAIPMIYDVPGFPTAVLNWSNYHLHRIGTRVGPVVRSFDRPGYWGRSYDSRPLWWYTNLENLAGHIFLDNRPSDRFGIVVESP